MKFGTWQKVAPARGLAALAVVNEFLRLRAREQGFLKVTPATARRYARVLATGPTTQVRFTLSDYFTFKPGTEIPADAVRLAESRRYKA